MRFAVASVTRTGITALLAMGLLVAGSLWIDWYVDLASNSTRWNSLLFIVWMALVLLAAGIGALFVGDLIFPRGWRDSLMQARGVERQRSEMFSSGDDEEDGDDLATLLAMGERVRSYTAHYSILLVVLAVANLFLAGSMRSGALWRIDEVQLATMLRSPHPERRVKAIDRIPHLDMEHMLVRFSHKLGRHLDDPAPEVAEAAMEALAHVGLRLRRSMAALRAAREPQRWEKALYDELAATHGERLLRRFRQQEEIRPATAKALGAFQVSAAIDAFDSYLQRTSPSAATVYGILVGLGDMEELLALPIVLDLINWGPEKIRVTAAWAYGRIMLSYDPEIYTREPLCIPDAIQAIEELLQLAELPVRCALVESMIDIRDARSAPALFAFFEETPSDALCPRLEIERRYGPPALVAIEERAQSKTLRAIANIAAGNEEVVDWLAREMREERHGDMIRHELIHIHRMARESLDR